MGGAWLNEYLSTGKSSSSAKNLTSRFFCSLFNSFDVSDLKMSLIAFWRSFLNSCLRRVKADYLEIRYEEVRVVAIHYVGKELEAIGESCGKGGGIRSK